MKLYLMQHGLAYSEKEDSQKVLSPEGIKQVKSAGEGIRHLGVQFNLIIASSKRRAQQTAALIAEAVRYPYSDIVSSDTVLPEASPNELLNLLDREAADSHILIVGHLPHLERLVSHLCGARIQITNGGLACVERAREKGCLIYLLTNAQLSSLRAQSR